jgi:hypothetical protein
MQVAPAVLYQAANLGLFGLCHAVDGAEHVKSNITSSEKLSLPSLFRTVKHFYNVTHTVVWLSQNMVS